MVAPTRRREGRAVSPLTRRILAVNVLALAILVAGLLYLGQYRRGLIDAELYSLQIQAEMFAVALGEGAVASDLLAGQHILPEAARSIVRRLAVATGVRARLFTAEGVLLIDSHTVAGPAGPVQIETLPPPGESSPWLGRLLDLYDWITGWLPGADDFPPYEEDPQQVAESYSEVIEALGGETATAVRALGGRRSLLVSAVPVQRYKQVLGAVYLARPGDDIDAAVFDVRLDILKIFLVSLAITVLLSVYLARTIARPIRRLALAAERVGRGRSRQYAIPDLGPRQDEIGDLAKSLRAMTDALWQRIDAIERFAADVAHEIKNPLSSLRSAVETAARLDNPAQRRRLMAIILDDVARLDRLISDISDASRLDAELSRAEGGPVDVHHLLATLAEVQATTRDADDPIIEVAADGDRALIVTGVEDRIVQVLRNLIGNAISFSPPRGVIVLRGGREDGWVRIDVDDQGPGIPAGKEAAIFERFYTERPPGEKFGIHSGLGLSISKQIIEAYGGTIVAETLRRPDRTVQGSRFTVRLPAADQPGSGRKAPGSQG